jgi:hypothetical protein
MLTINKLPINAGMIRLISQIAKEVAKIPMELVLNNSSTWILAPHLNPSSVRKVKVGTIAMIRKTTLIPPQTWPNPSETLKTGKTRLY